ncbi:unnamed protein product [Spirodela intermedia]|uniref:Uncharacterized protein n=1 Tax=Spirodela intermedia TaxID=51605 RepID=A0A7I8IID4_SPIIN|nr:unnamed protein product [Spirodela intermedia]CAA6657117.1 unnamed protein product [Spirodela intermedia]
MSSEGTDQLAPMLSYSRDFLLSLREKDVCKRLPAGFDSSLLRSLGSSSLHTSKRSDYGPSSFSRVEVYSRGNNTRWDTRSSGSSDKDGNTLSDRDTFSQDSGRRSVSQYRRLGQKPEQDGLLGSGVFPRPSGYQGWATASKDRGEGHYQLNRSSEPYQPPRPYKKAASVLSESMKPDSNDILMLLSSVRSYSRKDGTDTYNDETFGSSESSNQNREEEERIRRESFELMRMEQRKVFAASLVSRGDFSRCSLIGNAPASRPLVPPGFGSTITETSINTQLSSLSLGSAVANVGTNESSLLTNGTSAVNSEESNLKKGSDSGSHTHFVERDPNSVSVPFMGDLRPPSALLRFSDPSVHIEYTSYDASGVMTNDSNEEKITKAEVADTSRQVHSASILNKLFGNAMTENGGTQSVEWLERYGSDSCSPGGRTLWFGITVHVLTKACIYSGPVPGENGGGKCHLKYFLGVMPIGARF